MACVARTGGPNCQRLAVSPTPPYRALMSAARIIKPPPMSGGDRKYYAREIHKAEVAFAHLLEQAATAHAAADAARAKAYALDCAAWNTALFIGELDHASPTIAAAIAGGFPLLEVQRALPRRQPVCRQSRADARRLSRLQGPDRPDRC